MTTTTQKRPASVPAEAWWDQGDEEWVLGPKDEAGKKHGIVEYWRPDGTLCCRTEYVHGQPHGRATRFHDNGEVSQTCTFVEGKLHGTRSWFSIDAPTSEHTRPSGVSEVVMRSEMDYDMENVIAIRHYDGEGRRVSPSGELFPEHPTSVPQSAWWDEDDEDWKLGRATPDNKMFGSWQIWSREGVLLRRCEYDDHERHGDAWERVEPDTITVADVTARRGRYHRDVPVGVWSFVDEGNEAVGAFDYGDPIDEDLEFEFFDDDPRPAAAWEDLAGGYRASRLFGMALAALGRAAGASGDPSALRDALRELAAPLTPSAAEQAYEGIDSVAGLIDGLVSGADPAAIFRRIAIHLDEEGNSRAALDFIQAALALAPDRHGYLTTRALIHLSLGEVDAARDDAKQIPEEDQRRFIEDYARVLFPVFDFWPTKQAPQTHYDGLPDGPDRTVSDIRALVQKYATRLQEIRAHLVAALGPGGETQPWMLPDLSHLLPEGAVDLLVDSFELDDHEQPDDPSVVEIDETLELEGASVRTLLCRARDDWSALTWLCWSCGLDRVALPERVDPPADFGQSAGMASERLWRCRDKLHMRGLGARMQGIPGFCWEGLEIDEMSNAHARLACSEYEEMQALMYWLTDSAVRSPWQDNLRGS